MAQIKSSKFNQALMMALDGRAVFITDSAALTANPVANDTMDFPIPAGLELTELKLNIPDMDSSTGLAAKVGFRSRSGAATVRINGAAVANDDDYFRAAGALGQATALIDCQFAPLHFEEPAILSITWTVAATTFVAGTVRTTMAGNMVGVP